MRSLFMLGIAFTAASFGQAYAQSDRSGKVENYDADKKQQTSATKPTTIIGMNLRNADGSSMGSFVLNETNAGQQNEVASKDFPPKGIDNEKYAKDMNTGQFSEAEEVNTCRMDFEEKDEKNN